MKKTIKKKLVLSKETLRNLEQYLSGVVGGKPPIVTDSCTEEACPTMGISCTG